MFIRRRYRDSAWLLLAAAGAFLLVSDASLAQSEAPTNNEGVRLRAFGQEAAASTNAPVIASDPSEEVVLPPIPWQLQGGDDRRSWLQRRRDKSAKARQMAIAEHQKAITPTPRNVIQPERAGSRSSETRGDGRASADVAPAAPPAPAPAMVSYENSSEVPTTTEGRPLRAFGSEPRSAPAFVQRALDTDREIDPSASKFDYTDPFRPGRLAETDVFSVAPVVSPEGGMGNAADTTPLIGNLDGIILVPQENLVRQTGARGVQGILNEGVILPAEVEQVLAARLNQPLSLASLDDMVREAVMAYRRNDMPVVDVLIPEQQIQTGVLQLVVIEGRLGNVLVEGNEYTSEQFLRSQVSIRQGEVISESALMQNLAWMNKNPFRRVDLIYAPGDRYGATDVVLRVEDARPFSVYTGYENSGNALIGEDRFLAGFNWGGPLFLSNETTFSYQYVSDFDFDKLQGHSGVWSSYLPWKHHLTLLGAFVSSDATIEVDDQILAIGGENQQGSVRYGIPLPRTKGRFTHDLELGFDYKSSNSNLNFNQLEVFDTTSDVVQFSIGYNAIGRDRRGQTKLDTEIVVSPGGLTSQNDDETFRSQRGGADSTYVYTRAGLERTDNLPGQFTLLTRLEGQLSSANLLASETLGAGGYDTVRGYEQRLVRGDNGILGSLELRTPSISLTNVAGFRNIRDGLQALTFYDYGYLQNTDVLEGEPGHLSLGSVGVGLRYQLDNNLSIRLDYGYQVNESGFDDGEDGRVHVGARATF